MPVGFVLEGDDLLFTTAPPIVKAANLRRDPRLAVVVDEPQPPHTFVLIEGVAEFVDDDDLRRAVERRTWLRYTGTEPPNDVTSQNVLVRVRPSHVVAPSLL